MADTGWVLCTSATQSVTASIDWTNPGNITADDGSTADVTTAGAAGSEYLFGKGFGLSVPTNAIVTGIEARIENTQSGSGFRALLSKDASTITGTGFAVAAGTTVVGSSSDHWGQYFTAADVNAANFSVVVYQPSATTSTITVDRVEVKVYYGYAPIPLQASNGAVDTMGAWTATGATPLAVGNIVILQVLSDGTGAAPTFTSATNIENLAGTDNAWTSIGTNFAVGSPTLANQHLWIGRTINTSAPTFTGGNSSGDDLYFRMYEFAGVNTGTTLAAVIENATAGSTVNSAGTSATIADASVQTLGANRLALNFVGGSDDNAIDAFTGMTGGTWAEAVAEYAESSGTDGVIQLQTATLDAAGTIDNGTDGWADATDGWGCVGFALIPAALATSYLLPNRSQLVITRQR
jgi:hypothetical protein